MLLSVLPSAAALQPAPNQLQHLAAKLQLQHADAKQLQHQHAVAKQLQHQLAVAKQHQHQLAVAKPPWFLLQQQIAARAEQPWTLARLSPA